MSRLRLAVLSAFLFACSDRTEPAGPPVSDSPDEVTLEDESSELELEPRWTSPIPATAHGPRSPAEPPPSSTRPRRPSSLAEPPGREHRAPRAGRRGLRARHVGGSGINGGLGPIFDNVSCAVLSPGRWARPAACGNGALLLHALPFQHGAEAGNNGGPKDVPGFGGQLQMRSLPAYQPEIAAAISYVEETATFADGAPFQLRVPSVCARPASTRCCPAACWSRRAVAPAVFGIGPPGGRAGASDRGPGPTPSDQRSRRHLRSTQAPSGTPSMHAGERWLGSALEGGGVSRTWSGRPRARTMAISGVRRGPLSGGAVRESTPLAARVTGPSWGLRPWPTSRFSRPERSATSCSAPPTLQQSRPRCRGRAGVPLRVGCTGCHTPNVFRTGAFPGVPEVTRAGDPPPTPISCCTIWGPVCAERPARFPGLPAAEWRTPPLWGVGLVELRRTSPATSSTTSRARTLLEAVLWHAGRGGGGTGPRHQVAPRRERW